MTSIFVDAKLMQKVIKAYACECFYTSMSTSTWTYTINTDIGRQDHIGLNIPISDAY